MYRPSLTSGYNAATTALNSGYGGASNAINSGYDAAGAGYANAASPLTGLAGKYGGATSLALNALGVNGAGAQGAARNAFTAGPAYNWNLDQGLEAINRRRSAGGMLASGNADRDAQTYGAGLASNEYDKWMQQLLGFTNPELGATSGAAAINARGADAEANRGIALAGLDTGRAAMLSGLASTYGNNLGNSYVNQGNATANQWNNATNARVGLNTAIANPYSQTYGREGDAQMQGSGNLWNLGLNAAKAVAGTPGIGTSLSNLFGGGGAAAANTGVAGGGYYGAGGNLYEGPGFYGR